MIFVLDKRPMTVYHAVMTKTLSLLSLILLSACPTDDGNDDYPCGQYPDPVLGYPILSQDENQTCLGTKDYISLDFYFEQVNEYARCQCQRNGECE